MHSDVCGINEWPRQGGSVTHETASAVAAAGVWELKPPNQRISGVES